jgi:uncharacterized protein (TIGR02186 family)
MKTAVHTVKNLMITLFVFSLAVSAFAEEGTGIRITPSTISIGAGYNGTTLKITGKVPEGSDVVLRFVGASTDLHMKEKGKVFNLLWMNKNSLTFKNVPKVCLVQSSEPFEKLGGNAGELSLDNLKKTIGVDEGGAMNDGLDVLSELIKLKKHEGLYRETVSGVHFGLSSGGLQEVSADLAVPSALAPGDYTVDVVAVKDGRIVQKETDTVKASLTGLPAWLSNMAFKHGLLYGIMATIIAILSGLLIGIVFQDKEGGAH